MHVSSIISGTPVWVWILFVFLVLRGKKALQPRQMTPSRMLVIPLLFFVWALWGIFTDLTLWPLALGTFFLGLGAGFSGGWANGARLAPATRNTTTGLIHRPGSPTTLFLVLVGFLAKYCLNVALALHPHFGSQTGFVALFGGVSGVVDGAFWGGTLRQFRQAFLPRPLALRVEQ